MYKESVPSMRSLVIFGIIIILVLVELLLVQELTTVGR